MAKTKEPGITKIEGIKRTYYRVQVRIKNGEHLSKNFDSFVEAKNWKRQTVAAIKSGSPYETTQMRRLTIGDLIDRYFEIELKKLRDQETVRGQLNWFKKEVGHITLNNFKEEIIVKCREKLTNTPTKNGKFRSSATVNRYLGALSSLINVAIREWRLIASSPLKNIRKLQESRGRTRHLSKDERMRLIQACKESSCLHLYAITMIAFLTGMRKGEILGLRWKDIDLEQRRLTLHRTKNGDQRILPLIGPLLTLLQDLNTQRKDLYDLSLLFPGRNGKKGLDFRQSWKVALEKAKIKNFHFHDTRHDFISLMAELGYPLHVISMIVGHRSHSITATRYSHLSLEHAEKALKQIGENLDP
jgi:integrase